MTVNSQTSRVSYAGNGSTVTFTVPYYFLSSSDLVVIKTSSTGTQTTLVLNTDYTVSGAGSPSGGSITCTTAPISGETLVILRDPAATQLTDYQANDPFPAETHERALDKLTMLVQRSKDLINRSFTLSDGDTSGASTQLPIPTANNVIGWNATATGLQNVTPQTLATIVSSGQTYADIFTGTGAQTNFTLSNNPGALYNMDVSVGGVTQLPNTDYLWVSGTTLTFTTAPPNGAKVLVRYSQALADGTTDSSAVNFLPAGSGATVRTVQSKLRDVVSVRDFGADPTGVADSTTAIQAAINSGAKQVIAPAGGTYRITNTLAINVAGVLELDFNGSELLLDDAGGTKSHIKIGDGITQRIARIKNIAFTRQQVATAGYAIDSDYIGVSEISGCRIYGNNEIYNGIRIYRGTIVNIQNNYIDNCINVGIYLQGTDAGVNRTVDVLIRENRVEGGATALSTWDFVEGVFCRDNIFFNTSNTSVSLNASSNANGLSSFKFEGNDFDTCGGTGLYIDNVSNIQVCDCWFSSNTADDLQIKSNVVACIVSANQFYPTATGVRVEGADCRIDGNLISGGTTCINLTSSANRTGISGNTLQNAQTAVNLSTAQNTHFASNLIINMSVGTVSGAGGTGTVVQNNKGDSVVGTNSFITVGASPFTYTAGIRPEYVSVFGGTVSQIALGANAISFTSNQSVSLAPGQSVTVTYSSVPFMVKNFL